MSNSPIKASCSICLESNFMFVDQKVISCPYHAPFEETTAVKFFREAIDIRIAHKRVITRTDFDVARFLTLFDTENPCERRILEQQFCEMDVPSRNERKIKGIIENLRREWLLPIGSHKAPPYGYYFITNDEDFIRWQKENLASALTALQTNYRVFRHNFRRIAGQNDFNYRETVSAMVREALEDSRQ